MAAPLQVVTTATQPMQQGQSNVLARLQALFPNSQSPIDPDTTKSLPPRPQTTSKPTPKLQKPPKFLKVRIVTWNMHDSLPKGDLEELLGAVPLHAPQPLLEEPSWPYLAPDGDHPYHIVIFAGQECPSLSGIPMGLGAGFKLKDLKDKEREKENIKDTKDKGERPKSKHKDKEKEKNEEDLSHDVYAASGWTSILEDWLCNGSGCTTDAKSSSLSATGTSPSPPSKRLSTGDLHERVAGKEQWKGPYQPLIKHRMMGLYLTVYIHRDIRSLVRGTSKSAVTAGLIGGRVGNKGGVGISLNIDGTTFLLINAHLAAHEGKVPHRLANLAKIKAELSVDDYLGADDVRVMAEDITDKFDYTFLCGDLNFRLDISRLHADWLISRQEYAQALAFDQLHKLMQEGKAFVGFNEGPIDFAPTFKYDVLPTLKRSKTKGSRHHWKYAERHNPLYEVDELDRDDEDGDEDGEGEGVSTASSIWTSVHSRPPSDGDDDDFFGSSPARAVSTPNLVHKLAIAAAAHKAKTKWKALLAPTSQPVTPADKGRKPKYSRTTPPAPNIKELTSTRSSTDMPATPPPYTVTKPVSPDSTRSGLLRPRGPIRSTSTKSVQQSGDEDTDDENRGVYDSSNKKRVPSWCDRILWKSTVHPDPGPKELVELYRPRTRVGQFFVNALRPLTYRSRRGSMSSVSSQELSPVPPKTAPIAIPPPTYNEPRDVLDDTTPFSRLVKRSQSNDVLRVTETPSPISSLSRSKSSSSRYNDLRLRRSFSAGQSPQPRSRVSSPPTSRPPSYPSSPARDYGHADLPPPVPPKDIPLVIPSRWRFFPFLNRDAPSSPMEQGEPPISDLASPPRKGDVACLSYNTLDDRGMRRLEGRSDHRPVIGSYAVYL